VRAHVEQRLLGGDHRADVRHLVRKEAAVAEKLAQPERRVRAREERFDRLFRNLIQRLLGRGANLRVGIFQQQHEDLQLFVRARRERAERGLHAHVAGDLAPFEEVQQWSGRAHRFCT